MQEAALMILYIRKLIKAGSQSEIATNKAI